MLERRSRGGRGSRFLDDFGSFRYVGRVRLHRTYGSCRPSASLYTLCVDIRRTNVRGGEKWDIGEELERGDETHLSGFIAVFGSDVQGALC